MESRLSGASADPVEQENWTQVKGLETAQSVSGREEARCPQGIQNPPISGRIPALPFQAGEGNSTPGDPGHDAWAIWLRCSPLLHCTPENQTREQPEHTQRAQTPDLTLP